MKHVTINPSAFELNCIYIKTIIWSKGFKNMKNTFRRFNWIVSCRKCFPELFISDIRWQVRDPDTVLSIRIELTTVFGTGVIKLKPRRLNDNGHLWLHEHLVSKTDKELYLLDGYINYCTYNCLIYSYSCKILIHYVYMLQIIRPQKNYHNNFI